MQNIPLPPVICRFPSGVINTPALHDYKLTERGRITPVTPEQLLLGS